MRVLGRIVVVGSAAIVGLSLAGATQAAALLAAFGLIAIVLGLALRPLRPTSQGKQFLARKPNYLARYRHSRIAAITVAAFAVWEFLEFFDAVHVEALFLVLAVSVTAYVIRPSATEVSLGVGGAIVVTAGLVVPRGDCDDTVSSLGWSIYAAVIALAVMAVVAVRHQWMGLRRPLRGRVSRGTWALTMFGLVEITAFIVHPDGLEIWTDAPGWAIPVLLALVLAVALVAGYAPQLVLGLVGLGVVTGQVLLAVASADVVTGVENPCGSQAVGVGFAALFVVLTVSGRRLFSVGNS